MEKQEIVEYLLNYHCWLDDESTSEQSRANNSTSLIKRDIHLAKMLVFNTCYNRMRADFKGLV